MMSLVTNPATLRLYSDLTNASNLVITRTNDNFPSSGN